MHGRGAGERPALCGRCQFDRGRCQQAKLNAKEDWDASTINPEDAPRAVREYLGLLDDAAFGAATTVEPKFTSHSDPASQWTAAR
jgi:hypothetical protein